MPRALLRLLRCVSNVPPFVRCRPAPDTRRPMTAERHRILETLDTHEATRADSLRRLALVFVAFREPPAAYSTHNASRIHSGNASKPATSMSASPDLFLATGYAASAVGP